MNRPEFVGLPLAVCNSKITHSADGNVVVIIDPADKPVNDVLIHICNPPPPEATHAAEMLSRLEMTSNRILVVNLDRRIPFNSTTILDEETGLPYEFKESTDLPASVSTVGNGTTEPQSATADAFEPAPGTEVVNAYGRIEMMRDAVIHLVFAFVLLSWITMALLLMPDPIGSAVSALLYKRPN